METQWSVIIEILKKLSNEQFQKDVWAQHKYKHPLFSFGETVNTLGDYFFFDSIKERELNLSSEEYELLDQYITNLLSYTEPRDASLMLVDPKWSNIMQSTNRIIDILKTNTSSNANDLVDFYSA